MPNRTATSSEPVYRDSIAAALGGALGAGLLVGLADWLVTRGRAGGDIELLAIIAALYALPALALGLAAGVIAGAFRRTHGRGALARLARNLAADGNLDRAITGVLLAAALVAVVFAVIAATASLALVAGVERKQTGALLLGLSLAAAVPVLAVLAWPAYRVTRLIARLVPRLGPLPRTAVIVLASAAALVAATLFFIYTRLDWRALDLDTYEFLAAYPAVWAGWLWLWYGPLDPLRARVPGRGFIVLAGGLIALALPVVALRGQPTAATAAAISESGLGSRVLARVGRRLLDRDGDGFSAFLGGPDCDDSHAAVHPGAPEIPGNGLDDNCLGGDRAVTPDKDGGAGSAAGDAGASGDGGDGGDGGAGGPTASPPARRVDNVVLIMVDTVRADRLGVAGYQRDGKSLTPSLDALARSASYFTHVYAQAPNTPRSTPSTFLSRYPSQIEVERAFVNYPTLTDANTTVFEVLAGAGVHTVGITSHFYFREERNARQGFDEFDNDGALDIKGSNKDIASPRIVPKVVAKLAELGAAKKRFALFVHLFEPHSTYVEHPEFPITERGIPGLVQKYDYEIAYVDQWIGKILAAIDDSGLTGSTLLVIYSDHGEAFGVHRVAGQSMFFHGQTLYDELMRVPVIIRLPGAPAGTYTDTAMLVDLAPTIVAALGVAVPDTFVGRNLLPRIDGKQLAPRPAYAELMPAPSWNHEGKMVVSADGKYKLYHRMSDNRFELYDLDKDPEERNDLARSEPDVLATMKQELVRWIEVDLP